jgi:septum formation protein
VLILASRSPQRRAILETLGVPFEVRPADIEEVAHGLPNEAARYNALAKARAAAGGGDEPGHLLGGEAVSAAKHDIVLGVDTLVTLGHDIYGKPRDADRARGTLRALNGVTHTVVSGVAIIAGGSERVGLASTEVTFRRLDERTLDWYIASQEWRDRAGGYAIQGRGAALVERIRGDYTNVVGLPVALLLELVPDLLSGS